jgi:hypothetical protein
MEHAVEFLSDEQVAAYGRFGGSPTRVELERSFFLNDADRELVEQRRRDPIRQLVLQAPAPVVAGMLGYHDKTTTGLVLEAGGSWNRYASGDHSRRIPNG